jgi:hypothetical protein
MKVTEADVNRATSHFWYISSPEEYVSKADFFLKKKRFISVYEHNLERREWRLIDLDIPGRLSWSTFGASTIGGRMPISRRVFFSCEGVYALHMAE